MTEQAKTYIAVVHKAAVPLLKGESLNDFSSRLSNAARDAVKEVYKVSDRGGMYMIEAFGDSVVYSVYDYDAGDRYVSKKGFPKTVAMTYKRDSAGVFEFGTPYDVRRVTSYEKDSADKGDITTVAKSMAGTRLADVWEPAEKGFWSGTQL